MGYYFLVIMNIIGRIIILSYVESIIFGIILII